MKRLLFKAIFCFSLLPFWAPAQSILQQKCELQVSQISISDALKKLGENCDLHLVFSKRFFEKEKPVSLRANDWTVERILRKLLGNTPVDFREVDGQVVLFLSEKKAAKPVLLSGYIEDAESGERLISAAVFCPELSRGTITNEYGFFSFNLPTGTHEITVSYLGYQELEKQIELTENSLQTFSLEPSLTLAEVIVTPNLNEDELLPSPHLGTKLNVDAFPATPDMGGESDLLRMVQMLPGIQTGADGLGGLNVRGSGSEHNLILLDGVPVYNPAHMFGMLSIFNTSAVKSTQVIKGGIPARFGGRLSSVIDVRTRDGSTRNWGGEASADFLSAKGSVHLPFAKGRGTLLLAGRRSHSDFLLGDAVRRVFFYGDDDEVPIDGYQFNDLNGKLSFRFSEKNRLFLSVYSGQDKFSGGFEDYYFDQNPDGEEFEVEQKSNYEINWGNRLASLRWNHISSSRLFSNTTLTFTRYEFLSSSFETYSAVEEGFEEEFDFGVTSDFGSDIIDVALRSDFELTLNENQYLRYGFGVTHHHFRPEKSYDEFTYPEVGDLDSLDGVPTASGYSTEFQAQELEAYFEDEFKWGEKWHFNAGLRLSALVHDQVYFTPEPRLSARFQVNDKWKINASFERMSQYVHRLSFNEVSLPNDVWIPVDDEYEPQRMWQGVIGASVYLGPELEVSLEGFAKSIQNETSFAFLFDENQDTEIVLTSDGTAKGVEFFLRKTGVRSGGWLSYTFSKSDRTLQDSFANVTFDFQYDRRHDFKLFLYQRFGERWQFGLNWLYGSPMPRLYSQDGETLVTPYPLRKEPRLKPYHRLDLSASYSFKGKRLEHTFKASVYNLYDQPNVAFYRVLENESSQPIQLLPRLLGLYYGVKF